MAAKAFGCNAHRMRALYSFNSLRPRACASRVRAPSDGRVERAHGKCGLFRAPLAWPLFCGSSCPSDARECLCLVAAERALLCAPKLMTSRARVHAPQTKDCARNCIIGRADCFHLNSARARARLRACPMIDVFAFVGWSAGFASEKH